MELLTRCKKLKTIVLPNCSCGSNALLRALYTAPNLESITLSGGHAPDRVQDIPLDLMNRKVTLFDCNGFTFSPGSDSNISHICAHFPGLEKLEATEVSNLDFLTISQHCPVLQDVTVVVSETIDKDTAIQVARNWPYLQSLRLHLTLDPLPGYDDDEEDEIFGQSCSVPALLCFIRHCPQLTYFNTVCRFPTYDTYYMSPAEEATAGCVGSKLHELYVDYMSIGAFREIQRLCNCLRALVIHHENPYLHDDQTNDNIDSLPLETALHLINNSSIKVLEIHNYLKLSRLSIQQLAGLQECCFSNPLWINLSGKDILNLVSRCPDLRKLSLQNCFPVQESFLLSLLDQCPTLTSLFIRNTRREGERRRYTSCVPMLTELVQRLYPQLLHFSVDCKNFC